MKLLKCLILASLTVLSTSELSASRKPLVFHSWPPKSKQIDFTHKSHGKLSGIALSAPATKQKTLLFQIRSDKRVPVMIKRGPYHQTTLASVPMSVHRPLVRPIKMAYMQPHHHFLTKSSNPVFAKLVRKAPVSTLKIKLTSTNPKPLHVAVSEKPYIYEKPSLNSVSDTQKLPLKSQINFGHNNFVPIHTIPAPNLNLNENFVQHDNNNIFHDIQPLYTLPPVSNTPKFANQYQVTEMEQSNDHTIVDPLSGKQKYFAPDPDPSLPTKKIRPATEPFNTPSNGQPLPLDVQNSYLQPQKHSIVQFTNTPSVETIPAESYAITLANHPHFQQFIQLQQAAPMAVYDPTYLVTQSRNLYQQYQKQKHQYLFEPSPVSYANTDLTQEVASDGQIIQSAKDFSNLIHPTFDPVAVLDVSTQNSPTFAALIQQNPLHQSVANGGFIVSNYFNDDQEYNSPASYEEYVELSNRQRENDKILAQANIERQQQLQQQLLDQDAPATQPAVSAYDEHQRLLQEHLGSTPLRIFVPDDDLAGHDQKIFLQKRSDEKKKLKQSKKQEKSVKQEQEGGNKTSTEIS
ncbi:uncharacterized protein LOC129611886 isoform X2 [Condylostylus longicornis]|uniref:uncharacterized protein LOC129611886 isoform X2 n=1 Tax=Condylostylus longicornis TaxID=2530218 RepID=UPI00244E0D3A|nr:uncharacterized protein LOC129611886 isoform X2 [Condylostylus longicornis]